MINRFMFTCACVVFGFMPMSVAHAQNSCTTDEEAIVNLSAPSTGSYTVWNSVHGDINAHERYKSGLLLDNGHVIAVGEHVDPAKGNAMSVFISEINVNGRVLFDSRQPVRGLKNVVKVLAHPSGMIVLGNVHESGNAPRVWVGVFDMKGKLLNSHTIRGAKADLTAYDLELSHSGNSFVIATRSEGQNSNDAAHSVLFRVNMDGKVMSDQAFLIGTENVVKDLQRTPNGDFLASGYIMDANGRKTGWVMRLSDDLRMLWQKSYPRGAGAEFVKASNVQNGIVSLVGTSLPMGVGNRASWVMMMQADSGNLMWQRYLSSDDLHFDGRAVSLSVQGLSSVLIDGQKPANSNMDEHARLMIFNPRGVMINSEEYFNGKGVDAFAMVHHLDGRGSKERFIFGGTMVEHQIQKPEAEVELRDSVEGWVIAAKGLKSYTDPCVRAERSLE